MKCNFGFSFNVLSKKCILFLFPWRDALGITIGVTPFRFGELFVCLAGFFWAIKSHCNRISKVEAPILYILMLNFSVSVISVGIYGDFVEVSTAIKYIVRNIVFIIFVYGFLKTSIWFTENDVDKLMRFMVLLQIFVFVIVMTTGYHLLLGEICGWERIISSGQYYTVAGLIIPRFMGTSSEAGYLAPILVMPIYYFINVYVSSIKQKQLSKKSIIYLSITYIMVFFSFSTATYIFAMLTSIIAIINNLNEKRTKKILFFVSFCIIVLFVAVSIIPSLYGLYEREFLNKIYAYFGNGQVGNWSANDRTQHLANAWNMFIESDLIQFFIGHGTGAYYMQSKINSFLLVQDVNEAYNLFLSTLTDRGVICFLCLLLLFGYVQKMKTASISSRTIYMGIVFQYLHWLLTGNLWLYYFWYEIVILTGISRYEKSGVIKYFEK